MRHWEANWELQLTSPSPHEAVWTDPAAHSAAPVPRSALGWCSPAPASTHHSSASASRSPPWSRVAHYEAPCTDAPTGNKMKKGLQLEIKLRWDHKSHDEHQHVHVPTHEHWVVNTKLLHKYWWMRVTPHTSLNSAFILISHTFDQTTWDLFGKKLNVCHGALHKDWAQLCV